MISKTRDALLAEWTRIQSDVLPPGSVRGRLARGTFWTLASTAFVQVSVLVASIATARILGKTGFGELGMVRSTVLMLGVLAGTGLGLAATKYVSEHRDTDPQRAGRFIGLFLNVGFLLGGTVTVLCLALAGPLAKWAMNAEQLSGPLQLGCVLLGLNTVGCVQVGAIVGFEAFRTTAKINLVDAALNLALIPAGAWAYGLSGAVAGSVVAAAAGLPVKQVALRAACRRAGVMIAHRGAFAETPALWSFALPSILLGLSSQPFEWAARLFLVRQPNGFSELGVFTAAYSLAQLVPFLPGQVSGPVMPVMSNLLASGDLIRFRKVVLTSQLIVVILAAATALPLLLFPGAILAAYGDAFRTGGSVLVTMAIAYVVCAAALITRSVFAATGRMWRQTFQTIIWGTLLTACGFLLVHLGALGLAWAYLIAYLVFTVIQISSQYSLMTADARKD